MRLKRSDYTTLVVFVVLYLLFLTLSPAEAEMAYAWVVCDGDGGLTYEMNENVSVRAVDTICAQEHEQEHVAFVQTYWPSVCTNQPEGAIVIVDPLVRPLSECMAYLVTLNCYVRNEDPGYGRRVWHYAEQLYGCTLQQTKKELRKQRKIRKQLRNTPNLSVYYFVPVVGGEYEPAPATTKGKN